MLVRIVENRQHQVKEHVEPKKQEHDEDDGGPVVNFPEWKKDVGEVRGREQDVHVEDWFGQVREEIVIFVVYWRENGVPEESEERKICHDYEEDGHWVVDHHNNLFPGLSHVSDVEQND